MLSGLYSFIVRRGTNTGSIPCNTHLHASPVFNNLLPEDSWALRSLEMSAVKTGKGGCLGFSGGGEGTLHKSSSTDPVALGMVTTSWVEAAQGKRTSRWDMHYRRLISNKSFLFTFLDTCIEQDNSDHHISYVQ